MPQVAGKYCPYCNSVCSFPIANTNPKLNPNTNYDHCFRNTFDYNQYMYSDYFTVLRDCKGSHYTLISVGDITCIVTMRIKDLYNI